MPVQLSTKRFAKTQLLMDGASSARLLMQMPPGQQLWLTDCAFNKPEGRVRTGHRAIQHGIDARFWRQQAVQAWKLTRSSGCTTSRATRRCPTSCASVQPVTS